MSTGAPAVQALPPTPVPGPSAAGACAGCGADLSGLLEQRCPACGAVIAPGRPAPSLTQQTARGLAWAVGTAFVNKGLSFAVQIALAAVLDPKAFGVVFLANSIAGFASVLQFVGVRDILVHRHRRFDLYANAATWLSGTVGLLTGAVMIGAGAVAAAVMDKPALLPILAITALTTLVQMLATVPSARLQIDMRQRAIGLLATINVAVTGALGVAMALLGFGVYALVLPALAAALVVTAATWRLAPTPLRARPDLRRWRYMVGASTVLLATGVLGTLSSYITPLLLSIFHDDRTVGLYGMALALSLQAVWLLTANFTNVLFPALSHLQDDPARLLGAFIRSSRTLAVVGVPLCFLQAALADPAMRLLFNAKWEGAIPLVQVLSIGMAFSILGGVNTGLMKAMGRFKLLFWITVGYSLTHVLFVTAAAAMGNALTVSAAFALYCAIWGPLGEYLSARQLGGTLRHTWQIFGVTVCASGLACGAAYLIGQAIPPGWWRPFAQIAVICPVAGAGYLLLIRRAAREPLEELVTRLTALLPEAVSGRLTKALRRGPARGLSVGSLGGSR